MHKKSEHDDNFLLTKPPKPPRHSPIHLPLLSTPSVKPRYIIFKSPQRQKIDTSLGRLNSSLTPTGSESRSLLFPSLNSSRSINSNESCEETLKTDIEKIIQDQKYFKNPQNRLNRSSDSPLTEVKPRQSFRVKSEEAYKKNLHQIEYFNTEPKNHSPVKRRKLIIPDIPKAKFGEHKAYNELDISEDFKTIEVIEKPREPKFKSRVDSLGKEQDVRYRILSEILSSKKKEI
jgi:hypothetical protein